MYVCCFSEEIYDVRKLRENWQSLPHILNFIVSMECCYYIKAMYYEALIVF